MAGLELLAQFAVYHLNTASRHSSATTTRFVAPTATASALSFLHASPSIHASAPPLGTSVVHNLAVVLAAWVQCDDETRMQALDLALQLQVLGWLRLQDSTSMPVPCRLTLLNAAISTLLRRPDRAALAVLAAMVDQGAGVPQDSVTLDTLTAALVAAVAAADDPPVQAAAASLCTKLLSTGGQSKSGGNAGAANAADGATTCFVFLMRHGVLQRGLGALSVKAWLALRRLANGEMSAMLQLVTRLMTLLISLRQVEAAQLAIGPGALSPLLRTLVTVLSKMELAYSVGGDDAAADEANAMKTAIDATLQALSHRLATLDDAQATVSCLEYCMEQLTAALHKSLQRLNGWWREWAE